MKKLLAGVALVVLITAFAGCGGDDSSTGTGPGGFYNGGATATKASGSSAGGASTSGAEASSATCKYLSASEASALVANPGEARVTSTDNAALKQTTCSWGAGTADRILLIANEVKASAPAGALKSALDHIVTEKVDGLGDAGGYQSKDADTVTVVFIKGNTQVSLVVAKKGVKGADVVAAAKKIAGKL